MNLGIGDSAFGDSDQIPEIELGQIVGSILQGEESSIGEMA
jgi:hypothetical protein